MSAREAPDGAPQKQGMVDVFDRAASTYDRVGPRFFSHFGRRLVELAGIPKGAQVLDVATGRGAVLLPAAEAVGPHGQVTGIDLSPAMVRETAGEFARLAQGNVRVCRMDAEHLELPDGSFDCVLCGFAVFLFPRLASGLAEMRRVLRPGGRIALTTWERSLDEDWAWFDRLVEANVPPEADAEETPGPSPPPSPELDDPDELVAVMEAAGFSDVRVITETADFIYPSEDVLWSSLWSHGARGQLEAVEEAAGPEGLERFKAAVFERLRTMNRPDGIHQRFPVLFTLAIKPPSTGDATTR